MKKNQFSIMHIYKINLIEITYPFFEHYTSQVQHFFIHDIFLTIKYNYFCLS